MKRQHVKTVWTRQEVEDRFTRVTGEPVPADALSVDLWTWTNDVLDARVRAALDSRHNPVDCLASDAYSLPCEDPVGHRHPATCGSCVVGWAPGDLTVPAGFPR